MCVVNLKKTNKQTNKQSSSLFLRRHIAGFLVWLLVYIILGSDSGTGLLLHS